MFYSKMMNLAYSPPTRWWRCCCSSVSSSASTCNPCPDLIDLQSKERGVLDGVRVVLVGPQHPGNVGSVCRAAANFECRDVLLVEPRCDHQSEQGSHAAANSISRDILQQVRVENTLSQAFDSCSMAVAFTRRTGKTRLPSCKLADLQVPKAGGLKMALVFGREDHGLHTEELLQCTHVCTISSGAWEGSLNLSHAVVVVLARLFEAAEGEKVQALETVRPHSIAFKTLPGSASIHELENLLHRWEQVFMSCNEWAKRVGKPQFKTPERLFMFLRKLMQRASPSIREVAYLHGFLTVIKDLEQAHNE